jgi:hypothetical protein
LAIRGDPKERTQGINGAFAQSMMLEMADGHTRPQSATCPLWMAVLRVYPTFAGVNSYFKGFEGLSPANSRSFLR